MNTVPHLFLVDWLESFYILDIDLCPRFARWKYPFSSVTHLTFSVLSFIQQRSSLNFYIVKSLSFLVTMDGTLGVFF